MHVNFFVNVTKKEDILYMKLIKTPFLGNDKRKNTTNINQLRCGRESVMIIDALGLAVSLNNQTCFVMFDATIKSIFDIVNSFVAYEFLCKRKRSKSPSSLSLKRIFLTAWLGAS